MNVITEEDVLNWNALKNPEEFVEKAGLQSQEKPEREEKPDSTIQRLRKYTPVEIVGVYIAFEAAIKEEIVSSAMQSRVLFALFLLGLVGTYLWVKLHLKIIRKIQIWMHVVAFAVWVFATGGFFESFSWWSYTWTTPTILLFLLAVKGFNVPPLTDKQLIEVFS